MNFKKTLLALSVATVATTAGAATVVTNGGVYKISNEGIATNQSHAYGANGADDLSVDIVAEALTPKKSTVKIAFDNGISFGMTGLSGATSDVALTVSGTELYSGFDKVADISKGTGGFAFEGAANYDGAAKTFELVLADGDPMVVGGGFTLNFVSAASATLSNASTLTYTAVANDNSVIESALATVAVATDQFSASVQSPIDELVNREQRNEFVSGLSTNNTTGVVKFINLAETDSSLKAPAALNGVSVELFGDFIDETASTSNTVWVGNWALSNAASSAAGTMSYTAISGDTKADFTLTDAMIASAAASGVNTWTFNYDHLTSPADLDTPFTVSITPDYGLVTDIALVSKAEFGEWALDASVINVPYLPVGHAALSSNVEISNEGNTNADIIIEAFDNDGVQYAPVTLPYQAKGHTVTKVSEADIISAFGLPTDELTKLSITFVIAANEGDITLVPYYKQGESRINVLSDQYKGE